MAGRYARGRRAKYPLEESGAQAIQEEALGHREAVKGNSLGNRYSTVSEFGSLADADRRTAIEFRTAQNRRAITQHGVHLDTVW